MKITKRQLKRIIKEEKAKLIKEQNPTVDQELLEEGLAEKAMDWAAKNIDGDKVKEFLIGIAKKAGAAAWEEVMASMGFVPASKEEKVLESYRLSNALKENSDWYDDKHETLADKKYADALDVEEAEIPQEDLDGMFDEISDELEDMGSAVAIRDVAEMWLDENDRYYRGVYIDTRPIAGDKVKIMWPGWDEANYGGHLG